MGSTRISGDVRCNPPRPIFAEQLGGRASALTVFLTKPRPRLGHIGKEYAARLRLFRGGMAMARSTAIPLLVMIAGSALLWAAFMAIHGL
jgi:hypothetical protein